MTLTPGSDSVMNILVLLPRSPVAVRIVKYFLKEISPESAALKFLCFETVYDAFEPSVRENIVLLKESSLNWWGLPSNHFIDQIFENKYNALVNLDPQFDPVMASIALSAPVSIRIGFDSQYSNILYNNLLKVSKDSGFLENGYLAIKKLLGL